MTSNIEYSAVPAMKPVTLTSEAAWDGDIRGSLAGESQYRRRELTRRQLLHSYSRTSMAVRPLIC
jgi:hypothetical protein